MHRVVIAFFLACGALVPATVLLSGGEAHAVSGGMICGAHGDLQQSSADFSSLGAVTYTAKSTAPAGTCTGDLAATTGDITRVAFKLSGSASCSSLWGDASSQLPRPMSGKLTITYQDTDPATTKPYFTKAFVRLEPYRQAFSADLPDAVVVDGQIFGGVGQGGSLFTEMLMQPTPSPPPATLGPTQASLDLFNACRTGQPVTVATWRWYTGGAGLLTLTGDNNAILSQFEPGFQINETRGMLLPSTAPIESCGSFGKVKSDQNSLGGVKFGGAYSKTLGTMTCDPTGGLFSTTGTATRATFSFVGASTTECVDPSTQAIGKASLTYANTNPATGRPYQSSAYVTASSICPAWGGNCVVPTPSPWLAGEAICVTGIVHGGVGTGNTIRVAMLAHAIPTKDWDGNGKIDVPTPNTVTMDSYLEWQNWVNNGEPLPGPTMIWTTAGPGYGTLLGDASAVLQDSFKIAPPCTQLLPLC
jgi:hypothetical protein